MRPDSRRPRTWSAAALDVVRGMRRHGALDSARVMAFNFFLSVVPLLVLLGYVTGRLVRRRGVEALVGPLLDAIPSEPAALIRHELERLASSSSPSIAPLSVVTFLWLTSSGVHRLMDIFELGAGARRRRWLVQRVIALVTVVVGLGAFSATAWLLVAGDDYLHRNDAAAVATAPAPSASSVGPLRTPSPSRTSVKPAPGPKPSGRRSRLLARVHAPWERLAAAALVFLVAFAGLAAFYRFAVEHGPGVDRHAWAGSAAAMATWLLVSWLFGAYLGSLGTYTVYYGGLAAVAVLLVWLYLTSIALLLGAEVNAMLEGVGAHE